MAQRDDEALKPRHGEHLNKRPYARQWSEVWIIEMKDSTPRKTVEYVEGYVGKLMKPNDNKALPATGAIVLPDSISAATIR